MITSSGQECEIPRSDFIMGKKRRYFGEFQNPNKYCIFDFKEEPVDSDVYWISGMINNLNSQAAKQRLRVLRAERRKIGKKETVSFKWLKKHLSNCAGVEKFLTDKIRNPDGSCKQGLKGMELMEINALFILNECLSLRSRRLVYKNLSTHLLAYCGGEKNVKSMSRCDISWDQFEKILEKSIPEEGEDSKRPRIDLLKIWSECMLQRFQDSAYQEPCNVDFGQYFRDSRRRLGSSFGMEEQTALLREFARRRRARRLR